MLIGYARVSTQDQTLDLQTDALKQAGCEKLFTDTTSGAKSERPGLQEAMNPKKIALARKLYDDGHMPVKEICDTLHIGRSTLYRYVGEKTKLDRSIER